MRSTVLYVIGAGAVVFGFWEFWRDQSVDQNAFIIGGVCLATAAGLQIFRDVWRRLRR